MSLKYAILVLLEKKPGSGYDLSQRFKRSIGYFWNASHQQIYQELKKLSQQHWVEFEVHAQAERPDRKHYRISAAGRSALKAWLHEPAKPERLNSELLVKIYAAYLADPAALLPELDRRIAAHREKLDEYLGHEPFYLDQRGKVSRKQSLMHLTLRYGIRYEWNWIEWLTEVRALLAHEQAPVRPMLETLTRAASRKTSKPR